ncbi:MAG: Rieske 2Fe-2S domain-containing protein [Rhodocyclaceae bacterium]|jgi:nitrite reductase/ring-hydroxylating ferredoxin subunit|nr:Rieske 2Fe-2S domain-containing protein [Rhodocyclaceae bacterium]
MRLICRSEALVDGGEGVCFEVERYGVKEPAFVVRHAGQARAFLNRCAHVPVKMDWQPGRFFDLEGRYITCGVHGALYEPHSGHCVMGPCKGGKLRSLAVEEQDGGVYLVEAETL